MSPVVPALDLILVGSILLRAFRQRDRMTKMRWFRAGNNPDIWDENVPEPINDLEAARRIRKICAAAADFAQIVSRDAGKSADRERYERAVKTAMQIALKISDDLLRDAALREIINLCVNANNLRRAEVLFRGIQSASIREAVLIDNPSLQRQR